MENTWIYRGQEPIKIKKYLQTLGMGHRMFNELKMVLVNFRLIIERCDQRLRFYLISH
jgi:hypothetical protein